MQNNQQQNYRWGNYNSYTPNTYSNEQNYNKTPCCHDRNTTQSRNDYNNQSYPSSIQYNPQNSNIASSYNTYGYEYQPTGMMTNNYAFQPINCSESKGINPNNQQNQYIRNGRNNELNSYNCFDRNNYSSTNPVLNTQNNDLYNNSPNFNTYLQRQPNLVSSRKTNNPRDVSFENYQRKFC